MRQEGRCQNAQQDAETCKSQRGKSETEKEARARQRQEDSGERKPPKNLPTLLTSFFYFLHLICNGVPGLDQFILWPVVLACRLAR